MGWAGRFRVGVFGMTLAFNVPLNHRFARPDHAADEAVEFWIRTSTPNWIRRNTVKAFASA